MAALTGILSFSKWHEMQAVAAKKAGVFADAMIAEDEEYNLRNEQGTTVGPEA